MILTTPTPADIKELVENIRPDDLEEFNLLAGGQDLTIHLHDAVAASDISYAARLEEGGPLFAIAGIMRPQVEDAEGGIIWNLTTKSVEERPVAFLRIMRKTLYRMFAATTLPAISNLVPLHHTRTINCLLWLGFCISHRVLVKGVPCTMFFMDRRPIDRKGG